MPGELSRIVWLSSISNFTANCLFQLFTPIFIEKAKEKKLTESQIGLIMSCYPVALCVQSLFMKKVHASLGSNRVFQLSTALGIVVCLLSIWLGQINSQQTFVIVACATRVIDGARESQFEVVSIVYFAEGVLPDTTQDTQARALSIYKTIGALGFMLGSLISPALLSLFGYEGAFGCFGLAVALTLAFSFYLLPVEEVKKTDPDESTATTSSSSSSYYSLLKLKSVSYLTLFTELSCLMSVSTTLTMTLADRFEYSAHTAYFFFVALEVGFTIGTSIFAVNPRMTQQIRSSIIKAYVLLAVSLVVIGPSNLVTLLFTMS